MKFTAIPTESALTMPELFTTEEVANQFGVSVQTIRKYIKSGRISYLNIGRKYLFSQKHIEQFISDVEVIAGPVCTFSTSPAELFGATQSSASRHRNIDSNHE